MANECKRNGSKTSEKGRKRKGMEKKCENEDNEKKSVNEHG